jgi:hypothetical protein
MSKQIFAKIKHEHIEKNQSFCFLCNKIYIINNDTLTSLDTILNGDTRYVKYNNILYIVRDFIIEYADIINIDVLHFDHLTEKEQRERKIIGPDEPYLAKIDNVSHISGEIQIRFEASKCQLLCGKCHVIETIRREDEKRIEKHGSIDYKSYINKNQDKKRDYANELKKQGCSLCNYIDISLPRFFHFDHIDPSQKINTISEMIGDSRYSFEHLLSEIGKCRILCLHCHMIHTKNQFNDGVFRGKKEPKPVINDLLKMYFKINQYDKNMVFIKQYASISEASRLCNISIKHIYKILDHKKEHQDFIFERQK